MAFTIARVPILPFISALLIFSVVIEKIYRGFNTKLGFNSPPLGAKKGNLFLL